MSVIGNRGLESFYKGKEEKWKKAKFRPISIASSCRGVHHRPPRKEEGIDEEKTFVFLETSAKVRACTQQKLHKACRQISKKQPTVLKFGPSFTFMRLDFFHLLFVNTCQWKRRNMLKHFTSRKQYIRLSGTFR